MPPAPLTRAVGLIIRDLIDDPDRGISQSSIGRRTEGRPGYLSQPVLSRIIKGTKGIDLDQFNAICEIFEVSIVDIIERAEHLAAELELLDAQRPQPGARVTQLRPRVGGEEQDEQRLKEVAYEPKYDPARDTDDQYE